jgi:pimeloyl-ACP methyl ester carboxylesterase
MFGKLVLPKAAAPRAIVLYVQTAESATVDQKRPLGPSKTFNYFDLYRTTLSAKGIGFFSYEGRGIRTGDKPPRFEQIDWEVFNTGTLDNKVKDILSAIEAVRRQPQCGQAPILLMGASEGALLAAEAAAKAPDSVAGLVIYGVLATNMRENFKYIMTDGAFLVYRTMFDTDRDGLVSKAEFEADPRLYRQRVLRNADFKVFDQNGDGNFSVNEMAKLTRPFVDAVDNEKFDVLQAWAKQNAAVAVPENWFKDHFAHPPIATFLLKLNIPIGCFHGGLDTNTPIAAVKALEADARRAGKTNLAFHYFDDLDHSLNIGEYFAAGRLPAGHKAIFDFIDRVVDGEIKASR